MKKNREPLQSTASIDLEKTVSDSKNNKSRAESPEFSVAGSYRVRGRYDSVTNLTYSLSKAKKSLKGKIGIIKH